MTMEPIGLPRTGRRARALADLLAEGGLVSAAQAPARPTGAEHSGELQAVWRQLGGILEAPPMRPGPWDLVFEDRLVVELDEELHFNRYRALTLGTSWSAHLPWRDDYRRYCEHHESECLAAGMWGKRWSNASCARMFQGSEPGDLAGHGAPRWKQRALYDSVKDSAPALGIRLARVSIYDTLDGIPLGALLDGAAQAAPSTVAEFVLRRVAHPAAGP